MYKEKEAFRTIYMHISSGKVWNMYHVLLLSA